MAKVNSSYIDASGNTVIQYACASINDAYEVGGILGQTPNSKLMTVNQCLNESETFGVTLANNTGLDYTEYSIVAYDDLVPYSKDVDVLPKYESQLLGVLKLTQSGQTDETAYRIHSAEENNSNYLIPINQNDLISLMGEHKIKSVQTDGRIAITIGPEQDNVISASSYKIHGLDIVLKDFITNDFQVDNLTISSITLIDNLQKSTPSTSTNYGYGNDTSDFNINSQSYQNIVVSSGSQKVCAFINGQYEYQNILQTKYTNWNETSQINFLLLLDSSIIIEELPVNTLVSTIQVEFELQKISGRKVFRTLTIDVWFKENHPDNLEFKPIPTPVDITPNPYTIYYRTSDNKEISELTDEKAANLSPDNVFVNRGYNKTQNCGWIRFKNPILELDGRDIFSNYTKLTQIVYWPTQLRKIYENSFIMPDSDHFSIRYIDQIPDTITKIGNFAFYNFGLIGTLTIKINSDGVLLNQFSFANNKISKLVFDSPSNKIYGSVEGAFQGCYLLEQIDGADHIYFKNSAFKNCISLKHTGNFVYDPYYGNSIFENCSSLENIKFVNTGTKYHDETWVLDASNVLNSCSALTDVYIKLPDNNKYTGYGNFGFYKTTFFECKNVKNLYVNAKYPPFLGIYNIDKNNAINPTTCKLYVPIGRTAAYNSKAGWGKFPITNIIEYTSEQFAEVENSIQNCAYK